MRRAVPLAIRHGPLTVYLKPLPGCPDLERFVDAVSGRCPVMWLDSARIHPVTGRWSLVGCDPWLTVISRGDRTEVRTSAGTQIVRAHPLESLRQILSRYRTRSGASMARSEDASGSGLRGLGKAAGLMGFLSYDLNRWIERLPPPQPSAAPLPEMVWYGMRAVLLVDHVERRGWALSVADPHLPAPAARRDAMESLSRMDAELGFLSGGREAAGRPREGTLAFQPPDWLGPESLPLQATSTPEEFAAMVRRALEHIRAGDIFQANVSQQFWTPWRGSAFSLYRVLRRLNPSPFACFLSGEDTAVVSCSPERLVRVHDGRVDTRPIAGTRPRGVTPQDDAMNSLELLLSEKERAEHLMLVDLARNDLGRVSETGSVRVNDLMALEEYSHVIHIVSDIAGVVRKTADPVDVIRAVFPGGTITGCPKVRCMEILRALEPVARGLYTGSLGYLGFDGTMDLNIAIRTMVIQPGRLQFHVGAGIVADSDPEREYHETLAKAAALMSALRAVADEAPSSHDHAH